MEFRKSFALFFLIMSFIISGVGFSQNEEEVFCSVEVSLSLPDGYVLSEEVSQSVSYMVSFLEDGKLVSKIESKEPTVHFEYDESKFLNGMAIDCEVYFNGLLILRGQRIFSLDELKEKGKVEIRLSKVFGKVLITFNGISDYFEKTHEALGLYVTSLFDETQYFLDLSIEPEPVLLQLSAGRCMVKLVKNLKDKINENDNEMVLASTEIDVLPNTLTPFLVTVKEEEFLILKDRALLSKVVFTDTSKGIIGLEKEGPLALNKNVEVNDRVVNNWSSVIYPGLRNVYAWFSNGKISKIEFQDDFPRFIRVLISSKINSAGGMVSYLFDNVSLEFNGGFKVSIFDSSNLIYKQIFQTNIGEKRIFEVYESNGFIYVKLKNGNNELVYGPFSKDSRIYVKPFEEKAYFLVRVRGTNKYTGTAEVTYIPTKGFALINDLSVEDYLYSVVSGEMPSSYHLEALKAQAVAARTYAIDKILNDRRYSTIGANLDDSINFQVYNTQKISDNAIAAVNQTRGQILTFNGKPAATFYYAVSSGFSLDCADVFGSKISYLKSKPISVSESANSLASLGEEFDNFLKIWDKDVLEKMGFVETTSAFFGWKIVYTWDEIIQRVGTLKNAIVKEIIRETPNSNTNTIEPNVQPESTITTMDEASMVSNELSNQISEFVQNATQTSYQSTDTTNNYPKIYVSKRAPGGIVTEVKIETYDKEIIILKDDVRRLFSPTNKNIQLMNNTTRNDFTSLPSNVFTLELIKDTNGSTKVVLYGRGYGHGVGMSQVAANNLARKYNWDYVNILSFFYEGTELKNIFKK